MVRKIFFWSYGLLLCGVLHSWLLSAAYSAPGDITIGPSPVNLLAGSFFTVPITLDVGTTRALGALALELRYDPTVIVVHSIVSRAREFDGTLVANSGSFTRGVTRFSMLNNKSLLSPAGIIPAAEVEFKVIGSPGSNSSIELSIINFSDTNALPIAVQTVTSGHITVFKAFRVASSDYDGDGKSDVAVWRPSDGTWYIKGSQRGLIIQQWGVAGDIPVPGDYDGDKKTDLAVWRPTEGNWYVLTSSGGILIQTWGMTGDIPVPRDYDGDGKTDLAVWRPSEGIWYILGSASGVTIKSWGLPGDIAVPADYDGDNIIDLAVWRPDNGNWYILASSSGLSIQRLGSSIDNPIPGDYDGNGLANLATWSPDTGTWKGLAPGMPSPIVKKWGATGDIPITMDFDHDNKTDLVVWRPSDGVWYALTSSSRFTRFLTFPWGLNGDIPVSGE